MIGFIYNTLADWLIRLFTRKNSRLSRRNEYESFISRWYHSHSLWLLGLFVFYWGKPAHLILALAVILLIVWAIKMAGIESMPKSIGCGVDTLKRTLRPL
jgi:hypothetical protein